MSNSQPEPESLVRSRTSAFTMIELSIVMVIIGLLVGGVLVGVGLMNAASLRATVAQYEKFNSAVNTFRFKYSGLPGDLKNGTTTGSVLSYGLCPAAGCTSGAQGLGDNNGIIEQSILVDPTFAEGEPLLFWQQLSAAGLIDGYYGVDLSTAGAPNAGLNKATLGVYVPPSKLGRSTYWKVYSASGLNYYMLSGFDDSLMISPVLSPEDSYSIDTKIDDGMPNIGFVQARGAGVDINDAFNELGVTNAANWSTATPSNAVVGDCITTGTNATSTSNTYARTGLVSKSPACALRLLLN